MRRPAIHSQSRHLFQNCFYTTCLANSDLELNLGGVQIFVITSPRSTR